MSKSSNNRKGAQQRSKKNDPAEYSVDYRSSYAEKAEDTDIEIDDFLLDGENTLEDEELLTKWGEDLPVEELHDDPPPRRTHRGKRRYGVFLGSVVLLLALVGVGFIASAIGTNIYKSVTDDSKLRAYDTFLAPLVMQDPQPFASPDKADADLVQNASLWQHILSNTDASYTNYDDSGRVLLPLGEVTVACRRLFGPDCQLSPKTPETESFYIYDDATNQYHVSLFSSESYFTPFVESISNTSEGKVLRVGYVSPTDPYRNQAVSEAEKPTPTKYMEYVLKTDSATNEEYVYEVREIKG